MWLGVQKKLTATSVRQTCLEMSLRKMLMVTLTAVLVVAIILVLTGTAEASGRLIPPRAVMGLGFMALVLLAALFWVSDKLKKRNF